MDALTLRGDEGRSVTAISSGEVCSNNASLGEGFGLLPFRSPLLRKYIFVSFPPGTEMFHFPGYASLS